MKTRHSLSVVLCGMALLPCVTLGVTVTQVDTFEDGTVQGWIVGAGGHPNPPANVTTGGPGGVDDNYLLATAAGSGGPGSKIAFFNEGQWAGDYLAAGIGMIGMHVRNFGPEDLVLRLLFAEIAGGMPVNLALTTTGVNVAAGSDWQFITFNVTPGALTAAVGSAIGALSNATELRLFHNAVAAYPPPPTGPPPVTAQLGVDNIRAVPEPASAFLVGVGLAAVLVGLRRPFSRS